MSSPNKKRKLNNGAKSSGQSKGLEYFFSKQKTAARTNAPEAIDSSKDELTDEELARKLQAEWDQEATGSPAPVTQNGDEPVEKSEATSSVEPAVPDLPPENPESPAKAKGKQFLTLQSAGMAEDSITNSIPLEEPPLTFDPSLYIGRLKEQWATEEGDASYALLTRCFVLVSATASRIKIVDTLVNCIRLLVEGDPSSLLPAVCILTQIRDLID